jgi:hypothetical protein
LFACHCILAQGEIAYTGKQYDPGTRVYFPSYGISFIVPREWKGGLAAEEAAFIMASDIKPGVGLAIFKSASSQIDLENYLNAIQNLGDNIILQPDGKIQIKETELSQNYSSSLYRGKAIAKTGSHGYSIIFFFAGPAALEKYYGSVAEKIASTASFTEPDPTLIIKDWQKKLEGMMLKKMTAASDSSATGDIQKTALNEFHLCKDGTYHSSGQKVGKWQVKVKGLDSQLILMTTNHHTIIFPLGLAENGVSLNGLKYQTLNSGECK